MNRPRSAQTKRCYLQWGLTAGSKGKIEMRKYILIRGCADHFKKTQRLISMISKTKMTSKTGPNLLKNSEIVVPVAQISVLQCFQILSRNRMTRKLIWKKNLATSKSSKSRKSTRWSSSKNIMDAIRHSEMVKTLTYKTFPCSTQWDRIATVASNWRMSLWMQTISRHTVYLACWDRSSRMAGQRPTGTVRCRTTQIWW